MPEESEACWFVATIAHPALGIRTGDLVRFEHRDYSRGGIRNLNTASDCHDAP